ncbi:retrovirus-related pol polyprotein from transposon RE1 [Citrus sinensis]|uniref:Retrovirus-related pol polyprotein from transposon RE1 n=1 Tax=Citrus sinensis TaxID=2711 RepID=A0ACB8IHW3_CITSI|nr:retrovirus-related pol polyprotein from transposon RE1 [Citrus sinensis]
MLHVVTRVVRFCDNDILICLHYVPNQQLEDLIHESLVCCSYIFQAKEHDIITIQPLASINGGNGFTGWSSGSNHTGFGSQNRGLLSTPGRGNFSSSPNFNPGNGPINKPPMGLFPFGNRIQCQIYQKMGHSAIDCYNRMNHAYEGRIPPHRLSAMISTSTSFGSPNWLTDTGANAHITPDNGNLMHPRDYNGQDTIGGVVGGSAPTEPTSQSPSQAKSPSSFNSPLPHSLSSPINSPSLRSSASLSSSTPLISNTNSLSLNSTPTNSTRAGIVKPNPKYANVVTNDAVEPNGFVQANKESRWRQAMGDEFNALQRAGAWVLVPLHPSYNVLLNKWVYRIKRKADGSIERYKARLVANGFHQQPGLDFGIEATQIAMGLHLCQTKYILDLLHSTEFLHSKPMTTPTMSGRRLSLFDSDLLSNPTEYRSVVDALQYLIITRPDISFAVNQVCQYMHRPTTTHWCAVKRILRYLKGTTTYGLLYSSGSMELQAFSDADYAGDPDDRVSTGGSYIFIGPNLISWSSKKQKRVSRSSIEVEYIQLAYTTATLSWFRSLFKDLHIPLSCPRMWCDNISAISLACNPVFHAQTRHVEVDYHYV